MAESASKQAPSGGDLLNLLWVIVPLVAAFFVKFVWVVALAFLAMSYMIRTGREAKWYLWALHLCGVILALRVAAYLMLLNISHEVPPPLKSRAEFVQKHPFLGRAASADFSMIEKSALDHIQTLQNMKTEVGADTIDPFTGRPLSSIIDEQYRVYYSIGPDQEDQHLAVKWDRKHGVFSPGDIQLRSVFVGDESTTATKKTE